MSSQPSLASFRSDFDHEPFVAADRAAAYLGVTRRTLLLKARLGKIPAHPLDPGAKKKEWRFKLSELDRHLCSSVNSCLQPT